MGQKENFERWMKRCVSYASKIMGGRVETGRPASQMVFRQADGIDISEPYVSIGLLAKDPVKEKMFSRFLKKIRLLRDAAREIHIPGERWDSDSPPVLYWRAWPEFSCFQREDESVVYRLRARLLVSCRPKYFVPARG